MNQLKSLKQAEYSDKIKSEIIKASSKVLLNAYKTLFNLISKFVYFPNEWRECPIKPTFKRGSKNGSY